MRRLAARAGLWALAALASLVIVDVLVAMVRALATPRARVVERGTGRSVTEQRPIGEHARITAVWTTVTGARVLCRTRWFQRYLERVTVGYGERMDAPATAEQIDAFIADYGVDPGELDRPPADFATLNELFARPLPAGARAIAGRDDPAIAVSPADGRLTCIERATPDGGLYVKGRRHRVSSLLGVTTAAGGPAAPARVRAFHAAAAGDGFAMAVCRLAPGDYHRFHWPVDGWWSPGDGLDLAGEYHSVAPPCVRGPLDVLGRNRRVVAVVDTQEFGDVAVVAVGAVRVGSVELTAPPGPVTKGAEMGRFRYGGSTVVVVFRHGTVRFDAELVANTVGGVETLVRVGSVLGRAAGSTGRP